MNPDDLAVINAAVQSAIDRVRSDNPPLYVRSGTVIVSIAPNLVAVHMDGDEADHYVWCDVLDALPAVAARVLVLLVAPSRAVVLGSFL